VKLLFDANLSWRLVKALNDVFPQCLHVEQIGLLIPASDVEIWNWAKKNNFIITTNDDDYLELLLQKGFPPKIILLRMGNQHTNQVAEILRKHKPDIQYLLDSEDYGVLEIY